MAIGALAGGAVVALWLQEPVVQTIDGTLTIEAKTFKANLPDQTITYENGVKATYGPTKVVADRLTVYLASSEIDQPVMAALSTIGAVVPAISIPAEELRDGLGLVSKRFV